MDQPFIPLISAHVFILEQETGQVLREFLAISSCSPREFTDRSFQVSGMSRIREQKGVAVGVVELDREPCSSLCPKVVSVADARCPTRLYQATIKARLHGEDTAEGNTTGKF